jgi:virginiamycin A acetyltransferase
MLDLDSDIPDPDVPRPLGSDRCVFIRPTLAPGSRVAAGRYSYYDASEDTAGFEESRVLYAFGTERLCIGAFCSIAAEVKFIMAGANHSYQGPTAFPFFSFRGDWQDSLLDALIERGPDGKGETRIGNDVWLGRGALIMPGVSIGDGSIVGAGSVVASDVAPYHIVAGNPARVIRPRFPADQIEQLLTARWWDWPVPVISRHLPDLVLGRPERVLAIARAHQASIDEPTRAAS